MALITINDLLNNKKKMDAEASKTLKLHLKELDGEMELRKLSFDEFLEIEGAKADDEIVYNCSKSPNFKDENLVQSLGVKENPVEGVEKVLSRSTIRMISGEILKFSKLVTSNKDLVTIVDEEVKN